ncbi:MAG: GNAT family N-acetyltransferase [Hyphomicrobiaceae bacterium]
MAPEANPGPFSFRITSPHVIPGLVPGTHRAAVARACFRGLMGSVVAFGAAMTILYTTRLRLEPFAEQHLDGLHAMNQLPKVMRYISGRPETREQTAAWIAGVQRCWAAWGTSWWAFIETTSNRIAGAGCIQYARREAELPADLESLRRNPLEIGWRLHPDFWRQGLASEAALCMAAFAFDHLAASELIAVRHPDNAASAGVMDRLRMRYRGLDDWYGEPGATHSVSRADWLKLSSEPL